MSRTIYQISESYERLFRAGFIVSLASIVFFLPIKIHYANIAIVSASVFWLLNFQKNKIAFHTEFKFPLLIFASIYFLHIIGIIYSDNLIDGLHVLEKKLPLLALPILFLMSDVSQEEIDKLLSTFMVGVLMACFYCYFQKFVILQDGNIPISAFITDPTFQNNEFSSAIPIHPAYLSSCIVLCILILIQRLKAVPVYTKILYLLCLIFFFITILVLMARGSLFAFAFIVTFFFFFQLIKGKNILFLTYGIILIAILIYGILHFVPNLRVRITDSFSSYRENVENSDEKTSIALHFKSWHCALESTLDKKFLFGHGTGDEEDVLVNCYSANGWQRMVTGGYDAHNEYLSAFVRHGFLGLTLWLFILGYSIYWSIHYNSLLYFSFLVLIAVSAISESVLRGQVSLLFYAFFNSCLYRSVWLKNNLNNSFIARSAPSPSPINEIGQ
jgi:O-antigen ligase